MPRHVIAGDTIIVTAGAEKGKTGQIIRVMPRRDLVVVQGVNVRTKHLKPTRINPQGGIITKEMPIHISNVSPIGEGNKPTRVRFPINKDGAKVRVAIRGGKELSTIRGPRKKKP